MSWSNYKDLKVYQNSLTLVNDVYKLINDFPTYEQYALSSQMRRAVVSVPSNIAEGESRQTKKEFVNFLHIAQGSLSELETQLTIAFNQKYISKDDYDNVIEECDKIGRMITNLILSLQN